MRLLLAPGHTRAMATARRAAIGHWDSNINSLPALTHSHFCRASQKPSRKP